MKKSLPAIVIVLAIIGVVFAVAGSAAVAQAAEPHPHIYNAYRMLRRAHYVLQRSCRNLSGERANALSQIDAALNELKLAIAVDQGTLPLMTESGGIGVKRGQVHPYIHDALRQSLDAKAELAAAAQDFGGHRTAAIQHVDAAIAQLQLAVKLPPCD